MQLTEDGRVVGRVGDMANHEHGIRRTYSAYWQDRRRAPNLVSLGYSGAVPLDLLKSEQDRATATRQVGSYVAVRSPGRTGCALRLGVG